jgi:uncharacterized protein (TIGR03790 family)
LRARAQNLAILALFSPLCAIGALRPAEIAVIANSASKESLEIAAYYMQRRGIPPENLISVRLPATGGTLAPESFAAIKAEVDRKTPETVQTYALAWTQPYRVGCMSITTAFAAGYDERFCASGCQMTRPLPYFNSDSSSPWRDYHIRPTMALAGKSVESVKAVIDRGIASDGTAPRGTGYLVSTSDQARNARAPGFATVAHLLDGRLRIEALKADYIENRDDVFFYFTGKTRVEKLDTLKFRPGAIADHLTSAGGVFDGNNQMNSLEWLAAGATGSYGTVVEPCSFTAKFPMPGIVMRRYLDGETLIESYWKSVAQPGQGIFIGEPLAAPYRRKAGPESAVPPHLPSHVGADTLK